MVSLDDKINQLKQAQDQEEIKTNAPKLQSEIASLINEKETMENLLKDLDKAYDELQNTGRGHASAKRVFVDKFEKNKDVLKKAGFSDAREFRKSAEGDEKDSLNNKKEDFREAIQKLLAIKKELNKMLPDEKLTFSVSQKGGEDTKASVEKVSTKVSQLQEKLQPLLVRYNQIKRDVSFRYEKEHNPEDTVKFQDKMRFFSARNPELQSDPSIIMHYRWASKVSPQDLEFSEKYSPELTKEIIADKERYTDKEKFRDQIDVSWELVEAMNFYSENERSMIKREVLLQRNAENEKYVTEIMPKIEAPEGQVEALKDLEIYWRSSYDKVSLGEHRENAFVNMRRNAESALRQKEQKLKELTAKKGLFTFGVNKEIKSLGGESGDMNRSDWKDFPSPLVSDEDYDTMRKEVESLNIPDLKKYIELSEQEQEKIAREDAKVLEVAQEISAQVSQLKDVFYGSLTERDYIPGRETMSLGKLFEGLRKFQEALVQKNAEQMIELAPTEQDLQAVEKFKELFGEFQSAKKEYEEKWGELK